MNALLDTHIVLWWFFEPKRLSRKAHGYLSDGDNRPLVSAATAWEIAIKVSQGKLHALPLIIDFAGFITDKGFVELPITIDHAVRAGLLPGHHHDPFDRILIAQAQSLNVPILSADKVFDRYDVKRLW